MNKTTKHEPLYTPEMAGSGQHGICAKCGLPPTKEGHDGCLGTLPESVVMNACCGHGNDNQAYVQYWDGRCIRGDDAINEQARLGYALDGTTKQRAEHLIEKFLWASQTDIHGAKNDLVAGIVGLVDDRAKDAARLDFLDECNRRLNEFYGTTYQWEFILNHNVTRLMCGKGRGGDIDVDLNDAKAFGLPSCRAAIDKKMGELRALKTDDIPDKTLTSYKLGEE